VAAGFREGMCPTLNNMQAACVVPSLSGLRTTVSRGRDLFRENPVLASPNRWIRATMALFHLGTHRPRGASGRLCALPRIEWKRGYSRHLGQVVRAAPRAKVAVSEAVCEVEATAGQPCGGPPNPGGHEHVGASVRADRLEGLGGTPIEIDARNFY